MPDTEKAKTHGGQGDSLGTVPATPLVFISHDSRDGELAEAFSRLLRTVTAGMLKSFRSSDKKGTEGIEFGDEWYKRLMEKLQAASDVVCLFTERSLDRPWILFEAGVAKGKLDTPVHEIALGVPLSRVATGPFYQFQNLDDGEDSLTKLVLQLAKRIPGREPEPDVVRNQVKAFKAEIETMLKKASSKAGPGDSQPVEDPFAKFLEEMKGMIRDLPSKVTDAVAEAGDPMRRRRMRRFHPMMFEEITHMAGEPDEPIGLLMMASAVRDEVPWLYEIAVEAYEAMKAGDAAAVQKQIKRLARIRECVMHGPMREELGLASRELHMFFMEFPDMLERMLNRSSEAKKSIPHRRRPPKPSTEAK